MVPNNTYKSIRLLGQGYNLYYSVWCNNEHELYDLSVSPIGVTLAINADMDKDRSISTA